MLKVNPHPDYPLEEGRYVRGNDFSPVAVCAISTGPTEPHGCLDSTEGHLVCSFQM